MMHGCQGHPLMDRKVVGVVLLEWLQWSPQPQLLDVVWCECSCSCSCSCNVVVAVCTFGLRNGLRATAACIFFDLNFQKCSGREAFLFFSLPNLLCATRACNF